MKKTLALIVGLFIASFAFAATTTNIGKFTFDANKSVGISINCKDQHDFDRYFASDFKKIKGDYTVYAVGEFPQEVGIPASDIKLDWENGRAIALKKVSDGIFEAPVPTLPVGSFPYKFVVIAGKINCWTSDVLNPARVPHEEESHMNSLLIVTPVK